MRAPGPPLGNYIISGGDANIIRLFSFKNDTLALIDSENIGADVLALAWSPNGKHFVSGDGESSDSVRVFSTNGQTITSIDSISVGSNVNSVAWSSGGKYIASADSGTAVRIFDAMFGPENCLIKGNCIADTAAFGEFVGTGIAGSIANNGIMLNTCNNNEVNFTFGIPNVYDMFTTNTDVPVDISDNISCDICI